MRFTALMHRIMYSLSRVTEENIIVRNIIHITRTQCVMRIQSYGASDTGARRLHA